MRLDKYLKVSRIIKRRPVAKEVADKGRIKVNGVLAKSSTDLKIGDQIEVRFGNKLLTVRVLEMKDSTKKEDAAKMYEIITNDYIDNANQEQRIERAEHEQRNRFMGWILFVVVLLFILPTYNLVETYMNIKQQEKEVLSLQKDYEKLSTQTKERKDLAKKLKDDAFAEKYARAKYYYSREGESIYPVPSLLP